MLKHTGDPLYAEYKSFSARYNGSKDIHAVLGAKKLFVLDMDGTFYIDGIPYEFSLLFLEKLISSGREYIFFTNNSSKSNSFYANRLRTMGIDACSLGVMTSGDVTINYLNANHPGARVYLMGTEQLRSDFASAGIRLVDENAAADTMNAADVPNAVDIVVCAFDMELTYDKLRNACGCIRAGALFLATHMDYNCPVADGFIPDCGSMCALITASTGVKPRYLGKPCKEVIDTIAAKTGYASDEMIIAGDRLYTDIATGYDHNVATVLVLSGETTPEIIAESREKPDIVMPFLSDLIPYL